MILLTLDLSSRIGWTCGPVTDPRFAFGSHQLPSTGEDIGSYAQAYDNWLTNLCDRHHPDYIVFEAPILPRQTQIYTLRKLYGLTWHTEFFAQVNEIKCREAPLSKIKMFMGIKRRGPQGKQDMVDACQRKGYDCENHDAADAIGVRLYTINTEYPSLNKEFGTDLGPLGMAVGATYQR